MWKTFIPAENLLIIYDTQHILAYEIPGFSSLSISVNRPGVAPMWNWPGPGAGTIASYMAGESLHESPSAQGYNVILYYVGGKDFSQIDPFVTTITIPIDTEGSFVPESTEPPAVKRKVTPVRNHGGATVCLSCRKGLHFDLALGDYPSFRVLVMPLKDLGLEGGSKALQMSVSTKEFEKCKLTIKVDMDEATGRVVIWGWDRAAYKNNIFIGDLV